MSPSKTRTTTTAFGDVSYETVECASCGTEVRKTDAQRFVVGDLRERRTLHTLEKDKWTFSSESVASGWACEWCREDGPVEYPRQGWRDALEAIGWDEAILLLVAGAMVAVVVVEMVP